jgi:hypothetical protein
MKKLLLLLLILTSCQKENNIEKTITKGTWTISNYVDNGNDETYHFNGYKFNFNDNGGLIATLNSNQVAGNWSKNDDDSSTKLNILFSQTPLDELNDDWNIITISESTIELQDISGDGEIDYLKFIKN